MAPLVGSRVRFCVVFAALAIALIMCTTVADGAETPAVKQLNLTVGADTKGVCDSLKASFGYDVCALLPEQLGPSTAPAPSPSPSVAGAPNTGGNICTTYDFEDPESSEQVIQYLNYSLTAAPVRCFAAFIKYCEDNLSSREETTQAFANWTVNYQLYLSYLLTDNSALVGPTCYDTLSQQEQASRTTGLKGEKGEICAEFPDADSSTPLKTDWGEKGYVTPVTEQFGGSCFVHSTVGWFGSLALLLGLKDESGQRTLTNATALSVQPVIDCYLPAVGVNGCGGGFESQVASVLTKGGTTTVARYPYKTSAQQEQNELPDDQCINAEKTSQPLCASLQSNTTLVFKLPDSVSTKTCKLSQSQLVRFLADHGPASVGYSAGELGSNWKPYASNGKTKQPWSGRMGEKGVSFCGESVNHAVLMTGYDMTDPNNSYFIYKNSWGTKVGLKGYFWAKMSPQSSPEFTDRDYNGTCGITTDVFVWTATRPPAVSG